jgi:hypothetical protein
MERTWVTAVMDCPAVGTGPAANGQRKLFKFVTATRTGFRAGEPAVNLYQGSAIPSALVFKLALDFSPARIGNVPCESGVLNHIFDGQVLNTDNVKLSDKAGSELVCGVFALMPDFAVSLRDPEPLLLVSLRAFDSATQTALLLFQIAESRVVLFGVFDLAAVAQRRQVSQPEVNTDNLISDRQDVYLNSGAKRHVIFAVRFTLQSDHAGACNLWQILCEFYHTKLWQANNTLNPFHRDFLKPQGISLPSFLESWVARLLTRLNAAEEVSKRLILVIERLSQACSGRISKPRIAVGLFEFGKPPGNIDAGNRFLPALIGFGSGFQRPIPNPPRTTKPVIEFANLCAIWVGANFKTALHGRHTPILQQKWSHNHDHP